MFVICDDGSVLNLHSIKLLDRIPGQIIAKFADNKEKTLGRFQHEDVLDDVWESLLIAIKEDRKLFSIMGGR